MTSREFHEAPAVRPSEHQLGELVRAAVLEPVPESVAAAHLGALFAAAGGAHTVPVPA